MDNYEYEIEHFFGWGGQSMSQTTKIYKMGLVTLPTIFSVESLRNTAIMGWRR